MWIYHILFIQSSFRGLPGVSTFWLLWIVLLGPFHVPVFVRTLVFNLAAICLGVVLLSYLEIQCGLTEAPSHHFPQQLHSFVILLAVCEGFGFLCACPHSFLWPSWRVWSGISLWFWFRFECEMHLCLRWCRTSFHELVSYLSVFGEKSLPVLCPFMNYFLLSFKSSLHILDTSSLWDTWFTNIFLPFLSFSFHSLDVVVWGAKGFDSEEGQSTCLSFVACVLGVMISGRPLPNPVSWRFNHIFILEVLEVLLFPLWLGGLRTDVVSVRMPVPFLALLSGLRIQCCHRLQSRSQIWLRSGIAVV